jgi:hypothetical protein
MPCPYFAFLRSLRLNHLLFSTLRSEGAMNRAPTFASFAFFARDYLLAFVLFVTFVVKILLLIQLL